MCCSSRGIGHAYSRAAPRAERRKADKKWRRGATQSSCWLTRPPGAYRGPSGSPSNVPSASGTNHKEDPIPTTKILTATALALIALGTPVAHATSAFPPGPTANAGSAFPPGPSATIVSAYPPGPGVEAAYPPGPTKSIIAI
jgi:hypothetical protein